MNKRQILCALLAIVLLVCAVKLGRYAWESYQITRRNQEIQQIAQPTAAPEATAAPVEIPIDFAALQQQNPDIYAWIEAPFCEEGMPILRHPTEDDYYLNHTVDHKSGLPGSLYTQQCNAADFSDFNTVIYGHNMKNGTMFGHLKWYRDPEYLAEHRDIVVYTPTEKRVYRVFAAVVYSDAHILGKYNLFAEDTDKIQFLESLSQTGDPASQVLDDIPVDENNQLLTLSTCVGGRPRNRFLVVAAYCGDGIEEAAEATPAPTATAAP